LFPGLPLPPVPIKGKVPNEKGEPIAGANVLIKGTHKGASTNAGGEFTLDADKGEVLLISYVGYLTQEFTIRDDKNISISLALNTQQLGELVVTALGIQRRSKSLTYSTQKISNADLTTV